MAEIPEWNIAVINGEPEVVINAAALRVLMRESPYGEAAARQILIARGVPAALLDDPEATFETFRAGGVRYTGEDDE